VLRTWTYRTWKPIVGVVLLLLGMIIVLPLLAFPILLVGAAFESGDGDYLQTVLDAATLERLTPSGLLYLNVALGALILWCGLLTRVLHHLRLRWLSSVVPKLRWKFMAACGAVAVVALVAQVVVGALLPTSANPEASTEPNPLTGTTIALIVVVVLTTPFQAAGEEYAFRGYLLQAVGALARHKWVSILLTALLFAVAHLQFSPPLFFDRFMFGLIAAWLVIRTGGLEAGIALHVLNNWLAFGFAIAFTDLESALDPGEVSWWNVPVTLTQSLIYAVLVLWVARRMKVQRASRPPHLEDQPDQPDQPERVPAASV
jgi:membrane protease YdiL (CAAX protease family)